MLSHDFDESEDVGIGIFPRYMKWEHLSRKMNRTVKKIFNLQNDNEDKKIIFDSLYTDGNLDFEKLKEILNQIKEEKWNKFIDHEIFLGNEYQYIFENVNRIEIFKLITSTDFGFFPSEVSNALLEFHGITPK